MQSTTKINNPSEFEFMWKLALMLPFMVFAFFLSCKIKNIGYKNVWQGYSTKLLYCNSCRSTPQGANIQQLKLLCK